MGKLECVVLDTSQVAANCRQLLMVYNLGQRLFAKSILNQSQGSLSELLSKPRPWARLTEKGREAFRKMQAWVSDERAITLLRSLSPRRCYVAQFGLSSVSLPPTQPSALPTVSSPSATAAAPAAPACAALADEKPTLPPASERAGSPERPPNNRWRHDDIPKEMVQEIYERELAKLREQENSISNQVAAKSKSLLSPASDPARSAQSSPASMPRLTPSNKHDLSALSAISTLQHNASSSPGLTQDRHLGSPFPERQPRQRGLLRAVLPQITQEQFEQFSHINTEDLVHHVKDFLSQHSISQRLFGEHVLGLSQGSVSDLLARPKPWHMLTQKGREPFIRMQLFLDDPAALAALRARKAPRGASTNISTQSPLNSSASAATDSPLLPKGDVADLIASISRATQQAVTAGAKATAANGAPALDAPSDTLSSDGDLDTSAVSDAVRRLLHENSIGQKVSPLLSETSEDEAINRLFEALRRGRPWSVPGDRE